MTNSIQNEKSIYRAYCIQCNMARTILVRKAPSVVEMDAAGEVMRFDSVDSALDHCIKHALYSGSPASETLDKWAPGWRDGPYAGEIGMHWMDNELCYAGAVIEIHESYSRGLEPEEIEEEDGCIQESNWTVVTRLRVLAREEYR